MCAVVYCNINRSVDKSCMCVLLATYSKKTMASDTVCSLTQEEKAVLNKLEKLSRRPGRKAYTTIEAKPKYNKIYGTFCKACHRETSQDLVHICLFTDCKPHTWEVCTTRGGGYLSGHPEEQKRRDEEKAAYTKRKAIWEKKQEEEYQLTLSLWETSRKNRKEGKKEKKEKRRNTFKFKDGDSVHSHLSPETSK